MSKETPYQPKTQMRRQIQNIRGIDYSINEWGDPDAPLLVYLHGWADTGSTFQFVVDQFKHDWRIVAPDWRGFGRSSQSGSGYWFPDYLADLHAVLEHYSPAASARLVGHSMGGNIGSLYAGIYPERVSAFINVEGFGLPDSSPEDAPTRYREWIEALIEPPRFMSYSSFSSLAMRIRKRSPGIDPAMSEFVAREWAFEGDDGNIHLWTDPAHKLPNPVLYRRSEGEACWANITARTLLVYGGDSHFVERIGGLSAIKIPDAGHQLLEESGHMLHFEVPGALAATIEEFLQKAL